MWLQHPELAPQRRAASAAFRAGASLAGLCTRFPAHPVCGARTKRGSRCKAPKVAGSTRCRHHGGGRVLLHRARQTLARTRSRSIMAKCLWYLEKAHRNRVRQHLKTGERQLSLREKQAEQATASISGAICEGGMLSDLVRRLYCAGGAGPPVPSAGRRVCCRCVLDFAVQWRAFAAAFRGFRFRTSA